MAQSYTRQSTFTDGDTITAALFNDEYNQLLNAFAYSNTSDASTGHRHDGTAGEGGNIHTIGDLDFNNKIVVDSTNNRWGFYVEVSSAAVEQIRIQDGAIIPVTDSDVDLGTSSLYWKDAYIDSVTTTGNISIGGNLTVTGNATISGNLTFGDADTDSITLTADVASSITPDTDDTYDLGSSTKEWRDIYIDGTAYLDAINFNGTAITATAAELNIMDGVTSTTAELNILDGVTATATEINVIDGDTAATSTTLADADRVVVNDAGTMKQVALTDFETYFESAIDTINGNLTITGDLTISGDDLVMATNTAGHLLIADGTNFNPTAVGDLAEISTVANDDVLLAVDTSGGGLKKISRSTLVAGLSAGTEISNVVEDTTPQLGGDLDVNGQDIVSVSNGNITITPNGTGLVRLDGNVDIQSGEIVLKNSGSVSNIKFYCESSNAHYTQLQSAAHADYSGNVTLTLPASTDTLVGRATTDTLTNKRLTSPKINEDVVLSATATELNVLDGITSTTAELNLVDGSSAGTIVNSKAVVYGSSGEVNATTLQIAGTSITSTAAELNILDGVTATTAELNYTDGVTSNIQTQLDSKVGANYTGDVDITGELLVDSYNETFKKVSSVSTTLGYQLSSASYTQNFSVSSQDTEPTGIAFNSDGTKMFIVGATGDDVNEYTLSTGFDVSTASYSQNFSVASQTTDPMGIAFNSDGTKMFVLSAYLNDNVNEYTLSTGFDVSTASYSQNFSVATQETSPKDIAFNNDGTKMFIVGGAGEDVNEYTLSTGFNVSTASYSQNFSLSSQETSPTGIDFNSDGTKMFIVGSSGDDVNEYTLSTGFDVSTASYSQNFSIASQETAPESIVFSSDGTKMFIVGKTGDDVNEYSTSTTTYSTTFDCENANVFETELDANTTVVFSNPPASGTPVVTGYEIGSASYASKSFAVSSQDTAPYGGIFMKPDGTKMWYLSANLSDVFQYSLSTAYDVSTASYDSVSFSVTAQDDTPQEIYFKPDGTKFYVVGDTNNTVFQYALSTAWDLSTASYESKSFSVGTQETAPKGIEFKPDGTKMFIVGASGDDVNRYSLSTAWDVSTASFDSQTLDVSSQDTAPQSIAFNSDGTVLFMLGQTNDKVFKYTLSTAYDLSTGSYSSTDFSIASQENIPYGLHFNDSGKKMYVLGDQNDTVYQYDTYASNLNDSTAYAMSLKVVQDSGASGYTVTWPTSVDWPSATAPTLTATASAVDQFVFYTYDGGTTWYGFTAGQALG